MTTWSTPGSASLLAHGVHYAVTVGGIIGLLALLLPQMFERRRHAPAMPRDGHEFRVAHVRASLATGDRDRHPDPGPPYRCARGQPGCARGPIAPAPASRRRGQHREWGPSVTGSREG